MRRRGHALLALVSLLPCWGCSFIFVRGPPAPTAAAAPDAQCTRAAVAPSIDLAAAVILGAFGVADVATRNDPGCPGPDCYFNGASITRGTGILLLGAAAVSAASSIYGYVKVHRCETWTEARGQRHHAFLGAQRSA